MGAFIKVTNKAGEVQEIPAHWLAHPVLGAGFQEIKKEPAGKTAAKKKEEAK